MSAIFDRSSRSCLPVHVCFGPKATYIRRYHEMTRWANKRHSLGYSIGRSSNLSPLA
jgi:hypothetical protein